MSMGSKLQALTAKDFYTALKNIIFNLDKTVRLFLSLWK